MIHAARQGRVLERDAPNAAAAAAAEKNRFLRTSTTQTWTAVGHTLEWALEKPSVHYPRLTIHDTRLNAYGPLWRPASPAQQPAAVCIPATPAAEEDSSSNWVPSKAASRAKAIPAGAIKTAVFAGDVASGAVLAAVPEEPLGALVQPDASLSRRRHHKLLEGILKETLHAQTRETAAPRTLAERKDLDPAVEESAAVAEVPPSPRMQKPGAVPPSGATREATDGGPQPGTARETAEEAQTHAGMARKLGEGVPSDHATEEVAQAGLPAGTPREVLDEAAPPSNEAGLSDSSPGPVRAPKPGGAHPLPPKQVEPAKNRGRAPETRAQPYTLPRSCKRASHGRLMWTQHTESDIWGTTPSWLSWGCPARPSTGSRTGARSASRSTAVSSELESMNE